MIIPRPGLWLRLRLHLVLLWHSWPTRWAHKPLCARFRGDVLRLGRLHLCRSCACAYGGLGCGLAMVLWMRPLAVTIHGPVLALVLGGSLPFWYRYWPRPFRDVLRLALGMSVSLPLALLGTDRAVVAAASWLLLIMAWCLYRQHRARHRATVCSGCHQLHRARICSGFRRHAAGLRRYEERATQMLYDALPH